MRASLRYLVPWLALTPASALAQRAGDVSANDRDRAGPYAYVGVGGVSIDESCRSCRDLSGTGVGLRAGFGWAIVPKLSVEASVHGTQRADDQMWERTSHLMVGLRYRLNRRVAFRVGAGSVSVRQEVPTGTTPFVVTDRSPGWMAGLSYSVPLHADVSLDPYAEVRGSGSGDLMWKGQVVSHDHTVRVIDVGFLVRWHLRSLLLPKRQHPRS